MEQTHNLATLIPLIRQAKAQGADLVSLPEGANLLRQDGNPSHFYFQDDDPCVLGLRQLAGKLECWIHLGSALLRDRASNKLVNRTLMIDSRGEINASYDKMHLFKIRHGKLDIDEGRIFTAGKLCNCAVTPWGMIGLSICYDLRYPLMYRTLTAAGANMLAVPAAFTRVTGKAHWHCLVRARAIENACFVFAAAQGGDHQDGRSTYGHSLIVDPWGKVLAEAIDEAPQIITAKLTAKALMRARNALGSWAEDTGF